MPKSAESSFSIPWLTIPAYIVFDINDFCNKKAGFENKSFSRSIKTNKKPYEKKSTRTIKTVKRNYK